MEIDSKRYYNEWYLHQRPLLLLSFAVGAGLAIASADRGANCDAGFHFVTIFIWMRLLGGSLSQVTLRCLDAFLNGAILMGLAWTLLQGMQRLGRVFKLFGFLALYIAYALLLFAAFPMKDCL